MDILCCLGHKYNGCICLRCGYIRDKGHIFDSSDIATFIHKCQRCGTKVGLAAIALRPEYRYGHLDPYPASLRRKMNVLCLLGHDYDGCICLRCYHRRDEAHRWKWGDGCLCEICGKKRKEGHHWGLPFPDKCYLCGRQCTHNWDGCKCRICTTTREEGHDWMGTHACRRCGACKHVWDKELWCQICKRPSNAARVISCLYEYIPEQKNVETLGGTHQDLPETYIRDDRAEYFLKRVRQAGFELVEETPSGMYYRNGRCVFCVNYPSGVFWARIQSLWVNEEGVTDGKRYVIGGDSSGGP